jgi:hypothetical protein
MDKGRGAVSFAMSILVSMALIGRLIGLDRHFLETCRFQIKGRPGRSLRFVKTQPDKMRECAGPSGVYRCGWTNTYSITSGGTRD